MPGHSSCTLFDSDENIVVSISGNSQGDKPDSLQKGVWHILDFFKGHYSEDSPYLKFKGQFYDFWGVYNFVPIGSKIYVSWPDSEKPFEDCTELEHLEGNTFRIAKESGPACFGENVEFIMEGEHLKTVVYAGCPVYRKDDYMDYISGLGKKYEDK